MSGAKQKVVVAGTIASVPWQGGWTWAMLQFLLGFRRLGHEVVFVDAVKDAAADSERYFKKVMSEFGFEKTSAMLSGGKSVGLSTEEVRAAILEGDVMLNVSGTLSDESLLSLARRRVYLDLDPGFTQLWNTVQGIDMNFGGHTHFATIGLAIGTSECAVPTCGIEWITMPQPIVLERWPVGNGVVHDAFTTVANWRGYGSIEHGGVHYGQKAHSLRKLMDLPMRTSQRFELALGIHANETKDLEALKANRWELIDPTEVSATPADFQNFVRGSKAEFGLAKSGYVEAQCGWVSDRSLCYLASGRPVLAQDTGFGKFISDGEGLLSFRTTDEAATGAEAIHRDYQKHSRAARDIAEKYFDSDRVLSELLVKVL